MLSEWHSLSIAQKRIIGCFVLAIIIIYLSITYFGVMAMHSSKRGIESTLTNEVGLDQAEAPIAFSSINDNIPVVCLGTYVDSVDTFSIKDSNWSTTFYVWFNWRGDKNLNPGGNFQVVNGSIIKKQLQDEYYGDDGINYQQYLVSAKINQFFDTRRFPLDDQTLTICIEDGAKDCTEQRYISDQSSDVSSRLAIPGYRVGTYNNTARDHVYHSAFGDPRQSVNTQNIYSEYVVSIPITRSNFGVYFKLLLSLFAALLLNFAGFFIRASDTAPRLALPTGAFFGAVANTYVANASLPLSGTFGLIDIITGIGLLTIFLSILLSIYSYYLLVQKKEKAFSVLFDRAIFAILLSCCIVANVVIPLFAGR